MAAVRARARQVAVAFAVAALAVTGCSNDPGPAPATRATRASTPPTASEVRGLPPGWPSHVELGLADGAGGAAALRARAPFAFRYQYLTGGVNTDAGWWGWEPDGAFLTHYVAESAANGMVPVFTYYQLRQSTPGAAVDEVAGVRTNLEDRATMAAWFGDLARVFRRAKAATPVVVQVEPDLWGYLQQRSAHDDALGVTVAVGTSGDRDVAGFPDDAVGLARAVVRLRDRYAPNVVLGYHLSQWGTGTDLVRQDPDPATTDRLAARSAAFYRSLRAAFDVAFVDIADRDAGFKEHVDHDGGASWLDPADYERFARYLRGFHRSTGLALVLWQIPLGNTRMRAMDDTWDHYQDNKVEWYLDDPSGAHLDALRRAGVVALLFGRGADGATAANDAAGDGVTDPAPIDANTRPSLSADDDGGYFTERASAYEAAGPVPVAVPVGRR